MLDARGTPTGRRKERGSVHRDGDWHAAVHVWVGRVVAGAPHVLFQRRSLTKDTWPGALDVAVGGHVRAGAVLLEAVREAREEIGLVIGTGDLVRLGRRFARGRSDNEVQEVYAVRSELPLGRYEQHPQEVDGLIEVPLEEALALFEGRAAAVAGDLLRRGATTPIPATFALADFAAPGRDGYPARALQGLREVLAGREPVEWTWSVEGERRA